MAGNKRKRQLIGDDLGSEDNDAPSQPSGKRQATSKTVADAQWVINSNTRARIVHDGLISTISIQRRYTEKELKARKTDTARRQDMRLPGPRAIPKDTIRTAMPGLGAPPSMSEREIEILMEVRARITNAVYKKAELGAALEFEAGDTKPLPSKPSKTNKKAKPKKTTTKEDPPTACDEEEQEESDGTQHIGELIWRRPTGELDPTEPPISDVHEIFHSIVGRAQELGFIPTEILGKGVDLRVFTMCSGTEAPIIAMDMINKSQRLLKLDTLNFRHLGSAEIEPEKQAFIERNFRPPVLFRDVTEFSTHMKSPKDPKSRPYTAYGAQADPPRSVHMLIAGSSCVDFSALNTNKPDVASALEAAKPAKVGKGSESADTFMGVRDYAKLYRPNVILMENVHKASWEPFSEDFEKIGYRCKVVKVDSINYYVPQTRNRTYCLAIDERHARDIGFNYDRALHEWSNLMAQFQRPASSPYSDFMLSESDPRLLLQKRKMYAEGRSHERDWNQCRKRHTEMRNEEQLGDATPYTGIKENPVCVMDDSAWQPWMVKQSERVQEALDINFLRNVAQRGFDMRYKHRNINISQNVDRDKDRRQWGVVGCVTPSGRLFDTIRGGPLTGMEVLHLQGMPIGDLNLNKETLGLLHDLAGNAMTVPVIGVAIISALIACHQQQKANKGRSIFQAHSDSTASETPSPIAHKVEVLALKSEHELTQAADGTALEPAFEDLSLDGNLSLQSITGAALKSLPFCHCEGLDQHVTNDLRFCRHCFYTCCVPCNRKQHEGLLEFRLDCAERTSARDFVQWLTRELPAVLAFDVPKGSLNLSGLDGSQLPPKISDYSATAFEGTMRFHCVKFDRSWRVTYESDTAKLEFELVPRRPGSLDDNLTGVDIIQSLNLEPKWLLFAKPKPNESAGSSVRDLLRYPMAIMKPSNGLFSGSWQLRAVQLPKPNITVMIKGTGAAMPAWESTLGLDMQRFADQHVFTELQIDPSPASPQTAPDCVSGNYELHIKCPSASGTLYKKQSSEVGSVFLYLDPNPLGESFKDRMVFSTQPPQQGVHDDRSILAKLDPEWRPTKAEPQGTEIKCEVFDVWTPVDPVKLMVPVEAKTIEKWHQPNFPTNRDASCKDSASSILIVKVPLSQRNQSKWPQGQVVPIELEDKPAALEDFQWIIKYATHFPQLHSTFETVAKPAHRECSTCSPAPPSLQWVIKKGEIKAIECAEEATHHEQMLKQRPKPALAIMHCHGDFGLLDIQMDLVTMGHRATSSHFGHEGRLLDPQWRMEQYNHLAMDPPFCNVEIASNVSGAVISTLKVGNRSLWQSQREVLAWMQQCERQPQTWSELALVECRLPSLGWRVEVESLLEKEIRGGVVADDVGAGKTTTSLALVGLDYEQLEHGETFMTECPPGLIKTAATLIFLPKNIMEQWVSEISECLPSWTEQKLGDSAKSAQQPYYIVLKSSRDLAKCSVERLKGAHLVLTSLGLFQEDFYWDRLQNLVCAPNAPANPGRAFQEWLGQALKGLRSLAPHLPNNERQVWKSWENLRAEKSPYDRFPVPVAEKTRKIKSTDEEKAAEAEKVAAVVKKFDDDLEVFKKEGTIPTLLHMFQFRRVIVDEFTYIEGKSLLALLRLESSSRWLLSGTPPIHDFDGLNTMAKLLGTRISTYNENDGKFGFGRDGTKMAKDKSDAQAFRSFETVHSAAYKQAMYNHAAAFADLFMRKNKPAVPVAEQITHQCNVTLSPSENLALFDVNSILETEKLKFNQRQTGPKWQEPESGRYLTRLRLAIQELSDPEAARVCSSAILHEIIKVAPAGVHANEENILRALIDDHELHLLDQAGELFGWLRDLWYAAKKYTPNHAFTKLTQDVKAGNIEVTDMHALVDRLLWQAKVASADTPPTVRLSLLIKEEKNAKKPEEKPESENVKSEVEAKVKITNQQQIKDSPFDFDGALEKVRENEMAHRMDKVSDLIRALSQGFGRLRLLKAILALVNKQPLENCTKCNRRIDSTKKVEISMTCGHVIACSHCCDRAPEDTQCCTLFSDVATCPVSSFLLTQDEGIAAVADKVRGSMMQQAIIVLQEAIQQSESAVVFVQFAIIKDAFLAACQAMGVACLDGFQRTDTQVKLFRKEAEEEEKKGGGAVLVLKGDSEDAAGWNLQVANHVLFIGGMVGLPEEERAAAIEQAIGRCRRPGQKKARVHAYHLAA